MSEIVYTQDADSIVIELVVTEEDERLWVLLAHMADYLMATYGVEFDCDRVVIGLVYDPESEVARVDAGDARPEGAQQPAASGL